MGKIEQTEFDAANFRMATREGMGYDVVVEDRKDGTFTEWCYGVWGPIGTTGIAPTDKVKVWTPRNAKERREIEAHVKMLNRAMESQAALYTAMGGKGLEHKFTDPPARKKAV